jgi:hypothetical protein
LYPQLEGISTELKNRIIDKVLNKYKVNSNIPVKIASTYIQRESYW